MEIVPRSEINLAEIPVRALSLRTRGKLSCMLNEPKYLLSPEPCLCRYKYLIFTSISHGVAYVFPLVKYSDSDNGINFRDYRGLADLMGISMHCWFPTNDYVQELLMTWKEKPDATLAKLQTFFEQIDRYDVLDDTNEMFCECELKLYSEYIYPSHITCFFYQVLIFLPLNSRVFFGHCDTKNLKCENIVIYHKTQYLSSHLWIVLISHFLIFCFCLQMTMLQNIFAKKGIAVGVQLDLRFPS